MNANEEMLFVAVLECTKHDGSNGAFRDSIPGITQTQIVLCKTDPVSALFLYNCIMLLPCPMPDKKVLKDSNWKYESCPLHNKMLDPQ